ncbi:DNA ligase 4 [Zalerion maritima]|uniref:DNA ligase 4 n=1 Tax=Zalerion maritima TaxID=339359 RepID=A0AAD5WT54_9PEZI|nr:DNA ligase 4 [Zalerion maritima]
MPFPFGLVCNLLQDLEGAHNAGHAKESAKIIWDWFACCLLKIERGTMSCLLSTLLPAKRTDRVFNIQEPRLATIVANAMHLSEARKQELRWRYHTPGSTMDLAESVEHALLETPNPTFDPEFEVTVEEIDMVLHRIASNCRFSSAEVRMNRGVVNAGDALRDIYIRLPARDAKWFTRLILKDFQPVVLEPNIVYRSFNPLLPKIVLVRESLPDALIALENLLDQLIITPWTAANLLDHVGPIAGVKVGRQVWLKGRNIKHCIKMGSGNMSVEQKMDGEYCQVHIDLSKSRAVRIFSKSGKDSTEDREGLHQAIRDSLGLGKLSCSIQKSCILEGELLVYNDKKRKIMDFHHIRKHVTRSGTFLHTEKDSPHGMEEHLMIVYFDALMIDGASLLGRKQSERFERLRSLVHVREGYSHLVEREIIDFARPQTAAAQLRDVFSRCIISRGEGLVIKPDEPYFDLEWPRARPYSSCCIKLKKEYLGNFGDVGDFAAVAAYYDAAKAKAFKTPVKWTHFFIACPEDKGQFRDLTRAQFVVVNVVELNEANQHVLMQCTPETIPYSPLTSQNLRIEYGVCYGKKPHVIFKTPLVFDIRCFSFDKQGNTGFWSPRFPQVTKIHFDRSWADTMTFDQLQTLAHEAKSAPEYEDSQEMRDWVEALENADPGSPLAVRHVSESQQTRTTEVTISTPRSTLEPSQSSSTPIAGARGPLFSSQTPQRHGGPVSSVTSIEYNTARKRPREEHGGSFRNNPSRRSEAPSPSPSAARWQLVELTGNEAAPEIRRVTGTSAFEFPKPFRPLGTGSTTSVSKSLPPLGRITSTPISLPQDPKYTARCDKRQLCETCGESCRFFGCLVILAPQVTQKTDITSFLQRHGVEEIVRGTDRDEVVLAVKSSLSSPANSSFVSTQRQKGGSKKRKFCLVDASQQGETKELLSAIGDLNLRTRSGKRGWISCYDWRVVDYVKGGGNKNKSGEAEKQGYDPWRKWHVGLA